MAEMLNMGDPRQMSWADFVKKVNAQMAAEGLSPDAPIGWISWDRDLFGGALPDVYINKLTDAAGRPYYGIGED